MRIFRFLPFLLLTILVATACHSVDIPDSVELQALEYKQLLTDYEPKLDYKPWQTRSDSDARLKGVGGDFSYWWEHRTEVQSSTALWDLCQLSDEQLATMSTRNLSQMVYLYPYGSDYLAFENEYLGILLVMGRFNGTRELMQRPGGASELLRIYQEVAYPHTESIIYSQPLDYTEYLDPMYAFRGISYLSFLLMTAVDYGKFSKAEIPVLAKAVADKIEDVMSDSERYSWMGSSRVPYVLGAFVACRYDATLSEEQRKILLSFFDYNSNEPFHAVGVPLIYDQSQKGYVVNVECIKKATQIISKSLVTIAAARL